MPGYTPNYNLKKPLGNEMYSVEDQNGNMDLIDTALNNTQNQLSNFSQQATSEIEDIDQRVTQHLAPNNNSAHVIGNITGLQSSLDNKITKNTPYDDITSSGEKNSYKIIYDERVFDSSSSYQKLVISFPLNFFFGQIELKMQSTYENVNSGGGATVKYNLGITNSAIITNERIVTDVSQPLAETFHIGSWYTESGRLKLDIHKRVIDLTNATRFEITFKGTGGIYGANGISNSLTFEKVNLSSLPPLQTMKGYREEINDLKSGAIDVKTRVSSAINAKGGSSSPTDTGAQLEAAILALPTGSGVNIASGTSSSGTTPTNTRVVNGSSVGNRFQLSASVGFIPTFIRIRPTTSSSPQEEYVYDASRDASQRGLVRFQFNDGAYSGVTENYDVNFSPYYINSVGFNLPVLYGGQSYTWTAIG